MNDIAVFQGDGTLKELFPGALLKWTKGEPEGVLHIGAHNGEELELYRGCGFKRIVLVEPDLGQALRAQLDAPDVEIMAIAITPGEPALAAWKREPNTHQSHVTSEHTGQWVRTLPLQQLVSLIGRCEILVVDTSGTELDVLSSGDLDGFELIIVETDDAGEFASPTHLVRAELFLKGFVPVERWTHGTRSYGDEVYVRV
jgi:hypothetical protein